MPMRVQRPRSAACTSSPTRVLTHFRSAGLLTMSWAMVCKWKRMRSVGSRPTWEAVTERTLSVVGLPTLRGSWVILERLGERERQQWRLHQWEFHRLLLKCGIQSRHTAVERECGFYLRAKRAGLSDYLYEFLLCLYGQC